MTQGSRRFLKGLGIVVLILILFILTAPASLVSNQVAKQQNIIQLSGYQGRLVKGQVEQVYIKNLNYQRLSWDANPMALLSGALQADLILDDNKANLSVSIDFTDPSNWTFEALDGDLQVAPLTTLAPGMSNFRLNGDINFNGVGIAMSDQLFSSAEGTMTWTDGLVRVANFDYPLGEIRADLSVEGEALVMSFTGLGDLQPVGDITLTGLGEYQMTLNVDPAGLPANAQWLASVGKTQSNGMVQFTMKGKVRL